MKIEINDDVVIVYLHNKNIDINDYNKLNNQIRSLFIRLMKRYNLDFFGYNKVNVYHNDNYGIILEITKIYESGIRYNVIDLKIVVYKNYSMYLEFDDYFFITKPNKLLFYDGKYYLEINDNVDIYKYIEYGKVRYSPNLKKLLNKID